MKKKQGYIAPGWEKKAGSYLAAADELPEMSPEAVRESERCGMLKRWAEENHTLGLLRK